MNLNIVFLKMLDKFRLWWKFDGRHMHREFARGIKNLWRWFPTIWQDRDWDQAYIYTMLAKKLEFQAKYIGDRGFHTKAKRDAERMRLVVKLIKMQRDEFYIDEFHEHCEMKYEFIPTDETKKWFTLESEIISENFIDYFTKYSRQYRLVDKTDKDKEDIAREIAYKNQERSRKLLFKIMEQNIERWWD